MAEQPWLIEVTPEPLPPPPPPPEEHMYLVVAYAKGWGWRLRCSGAAQEFSTEDGAKRFAETLSPMWRSPAIVHVHLGAK